MGDRLLANAPTGVGAFFAEASDPFFAGGYEGLASLGVRFAKGKVGVDLALVVLHWGGRFFDYAAVAFEH